MIRDVRTSLARWLVPVTAGIPLEQAAQYLPADPIIVEAGASTGDDALRLAALFPGGHVHAFEPEPSTFSELAHRTAAIDNVTAWNLALGEVDEKVTLHVSSGPYGTASSSLLVPKEHLTEIPDVHFDSQVAVDQRTLSSWAIENGIERCHFLALDLQGMEYSVLAGSTPLVEKASVIICEVFLNEKFEGCATVGEVQALLVGLGFAVLWTNMFWKNSGDLLAVHRRVLRKQANLPPA